jgi:hypothetical protein
MSFEWRTREQFAEVAEALGIGTMDVLAMVRDDLVLYTVDDESAMLWSAWMKRDEDGILRVLRKFPHPGMIENLRKAMQDKAEED